MAGKQPIGGSWDTGFTTGDHEFLTPWLKDLEMGKLYKFKNKPLTWHAQLLLLSKLAADLNRHAQFSGETPITGDHQLTKYDDVFLDIAPDAAGYTVKLPDLSDEDFPTFFIRNTGLYKFDIDNFDDAGVTTLDEGDIVWFYTDGTTWFYRHIGTSQIRNITVARDVDDKVESYTYGNNVQWTVSRDGNGRITSLTDGVITKLVNRDGNGKVTGISTQTP